MLSLPAVLAAKDVFEDFRKDFTGFWSEYALFGALALGLVALILVTLQVVARPYAQRQAERKRLWKALVEAHRLTHAEQEALQHLASDAGLSDASQVFVKKSAFDGQISRGKDSARLTELRAKLF